MEIGSFRKLSIEHRNLIISGCGIFQETASPLINHDVDCQNPDMFDAPPSENFEDDLFYDSFESSSYLESTIDDLYNILDKYDK